ncbi:hypothetical protein AAF712_008394 [Marasmius tenuissimus]|uniref:RRM domain-containing protein n=1 Tax=Marasmius tenuissimus TaxID=585030 RepID=A0ABR2ZUB3_9AGAR
MSETVTKRLHISGLTPALTPTDLSTRLSTFGTVKSLDGFGLVDGVGQLRKFGYATIEATPVALKRCFTSLSGTTWKGAKLRIGEAKPDFRERLADERAKGNDEPPRKRQRTHYSKYHGVYGSDMSLVTRENAEKRPGWKVMPSGRIVRSMRMRPGKPLPPPSEDTKKKSTAVAPMKEKKRIKLPDSRARIRSIDVTKWNGEYLRGSLLDGQITATTIPPRTVSSTKMTETVISEDEDEEMQDETSALPHAQPAADILPPTKRIRFEESHASPLHTQQDLPQSRTVPSDPASTDFAQERAQNLSLLSALLGDAEWDGRESDSDIDESRIIEGYTGGEEDYEVVPAEQHKPSGRSEEMEVDEPPPVQTREPTSRVAPSAPTAKSVSLKDLFAPREEEGGFSLLNHLDLELDDELDAAPFTIATDDSLNNTAPSHSVNQTLPVTVPALKSKAATHQRISLDPKMPLFFVRPEALSATKASDGSSPFYQLQTEEQIRQRWEDNKVELTRGWKKRWREAVKVKRRRGGKDAGDGDA